MSLHGGIHGIPQHEVFHFRAGVATHWDFQFPRPLTCRRGGSRSRGGRSILRAFSQQSRCFDPFGFGGQSAPLPRHAWRSGTFPRFKKVHLETYRSRLEPEVEDSLRTLQLRLNSQPWAKTVVAKTSSSIGSLGQVWTAMQKATSWSTTASRCTGHLRGGSGDGAALRFRPVDQAFERPST